MQTTNQARVESLVQITGGKAEWYQTRANIVQAERRAKVQWDGAKMQHVAAAAGKLVKASTGSWGREAFIGNGKKVVVALTGNECVALGLVPGPANA